MAQICKGKISPDEERKIQKNFTFLLNELDTHYLLDYMYENGILELDDMERIKNKETTKDRVDAFFQYLIHSGGPNGFRVFCDALKCSNYDHVLKKLKETVITQPVEETDVSFQEILDLVNGKKLTDSIIAKISKLIGKDWELLAFELGQSTVDVENIKYQHSSLTMQILYMIIKWRNEKGFREDGFAMLLKTIKESSCNVDWIKIKSVLQNL